MTRERGRRGGPERPRAFHVLGMGLPKTGSTSLAAMFRAHRWSHELWFEETVMALDDPAALRAVLLARDAEGIELDANTFLHRCPALVAELFPEARFVVATRDAVTWAESFLNLLLRNGRRHGAAWPAWQVRYGQGWAPGLDPAWFVDEAALRPHLPALLPALYEAHAERHAALVRGLPRERTLWLPAHELDAQLPALAAFAGVPADSLFPARENVAPAKARLRWP